MRPRATSRNGINERCSNRSITAGREDRFFSISLSSSPNIRLSIIHQRSVLHRHKTDEVTPFRRFMTEHEVVIDWQGADSQRSSIIALAESLEGVEHEDTEDGLRFVFKSMELKDLRMMVDGFLEECAKIEQG